MFFPFGVVPGVPFLGRDEPCMKYRSYQKLGFANMTYIKPSVTYQMEPLEITADAETVAPIQKEKTVIREKFPWWVLIVAAGVYYGVFR